jgi:hypothetical protein
MSVCLITDAVLTGIFGYLSFNSIVTMTGFTSNNYILPFISSVVGIAFWLCVSDYLVPLLGENKLVNFISDNTFGIMMHHLFLFNVFNAFLYLASRINKSIPFDVVAFRGSPWYRMEPCQSYRVFYLIFALTSYVLLKKLYLKMEDRLHIKGKIKDKCFPVVKYIFPHLNINQ